MAAALGTWSAITQSKALRIEGHTSNVEGPIVYRQIITGTVGETTETGDTYIIPHKFDTVEFITGQPIGAAGADFLLGGTTTLKSGAYYTDSATIISSVQSTGTQSAGSTQFHLTTSGSAINDVYNNCYLDIRFSNGDVQTVKILDYVGSTKYATLKDGLAQAVAATGTFYTLKGTLITCDDIAVTPTVKFNVTGTYH